MEVLWVASICFLLFSVVFTDLNFFWMCFFKRVLSHENHHEELTVLEGNMFDSNVFSSKSINFMG